MLWVVLLLLTGAGLERLTRRPFLATRFGVLLAFFLGGGRLDGNLYGAPRLPAVGFRAAAQTWGETVLVTPGVLEHPGASRLLGHEACHVAQYRRLTSFGFWFLYGCQWLAGLFRTRNPLQAYLDIPLEVEARAAERATPALTPTCTAPFS